MCLVHSPLDVCVLSESVCCDGSPLWVCGVRLSVPGCAGVVTLECVRRYQCVFVCLGVGVALPTSLEWVTEATAVCLPVSPARRAQGL